MRTAVVARSSSRMTWRDVLLPAGQVLVAASLAAFGVQQWLWGDFIPGRAPAFPDGLPGRLVWAYLTGTGLIATGASVLIAVAQPSAERVRLARTAALWTAVVILGWSGMRLLPAVADDVLLGGSWTRLGKALMLSGGTLAVAGTLPAFTGRDGVLGPAMRATDAFVATGRACLAVFFILCGVQHFIWIDFVATLVPAWIPGPYFWSWFAGVALIAGGAGMLLPPVTALSARLSALMVFLWVVMLHVPRALSAMDAGSSRNEWTAVFEALAVTGIALVAAGRGSRARERGAEPVRTAPAPRSGPQPQGAGSP